MQSYIARALGKSSEMLANGFLSKIEYYLTYVQNYFHFQFQIPFLRYKKNVLQNMYVKNTVADKLYSENCTAT